MPRKSRIMEELEKLHKLVSNTPIQIKHEAWYYSSGHFSESYSIWTEIDHIHYSAKTLKEALEKFKENRGSDAKFSSNK